MRWVSTALVCLCGRRRLIDSELPDWSEAGNNHHCSEETDAKRIFVHPASMFVINNLRRRMQTTTDKSFI